GDTKLIYDEIKLIEDEVLDKQLAVDLPRCHKYYSLLNNNIGREKIRQVILKWISSDQKNVYWQGLDSICAPFVVLNYNRLDLALVCIEQFINKFLDNFFVTTNMHVLAEYLQCFVCLISFHDPELSHHLLKIKFDPNLYAISWFLTLFGHVFQMENLMLLWDNWLAGDSTMPLFTGLTLIKEIHRDKILESDFDSCITIFSKKFITNVNDLNSFANMYYISTPSSITFRKHMNLSAYSSSLINSKFIVNPIHYNLDITIGKIFGQELADIIDGIHSHFNLEKIKIIDIRSKAEYQRGHLPQSVHFPITIEQLTKNGKSTIAKFENLQSNIKNYKLKIIIGEEFDIRLKLGNYIVYKLYIPNVCICSTEMDIFSKYNMLTSIV
ncbi:hypothetical protein A3Q56_04326, partial [Intoshia linei]